RWRLGVAVALRLPSPLQETFRQTLTVGMARKKSLVGGGEVGRSRAQARQLAVGNQASHRAPAARELDVVAGFDAIHQIGQMRTRLRNGVALRHAPIVHLDVHLITSLRASWQTYITASDNNAGRVAPPPRLLAPIERALKRHARASRCVNLGANCCESRPCCSNAGRNSETVNAYVFIPASKAVRTRTGPTQFQRTPLPRPRLPILLRDTFEWESARTRRRMFSLGWRLEAFSTALCGSPLLQHDTAARRSAPQQFRRALRRARTNASAVADAGFRCLGGLGDHRD